MSKNKLNRFIINYDGNKYNETNKYLKDDFKKILKYKIIAEPFCGIMGFSRALLENNLDYDGEIWLNDIKTEHIEFLKYIKNDPEKFILEMEEERKKYKTNEEATKKAKNIYFRWVYKSMYPKFCELKKGDTKIKNYKERINIYKKFFKKVKFFNMDCGSFLKILPKNAFVFFDPPYFNSCNVNYNNKIPSINGYRDGTGLYLIIYNYFKEGKKGLFILNKLDFFDYFFNQWKIKEIKGIYNNLFKNKKHHIIYGIY